jgi:hypothetical protein
VLSLAGCVSTKRPKQINESRFVSPDISPTGRWEKQEDPIRIPLTIKKVPVGIYAAGSVYADTELDLDILPTEFDQPLVVFFAAQLNVFKEGLGGDLFYGQITPKRAIENAGAEIKDELRNTYAIESLDRASSLTPMPDRSTTHRELRGVYPVEKTQDVTLPDGTVSTVQLTGNIPVRVFYGCWKSPSSEDLLLVGGAYPENNEITLTGPVTGEYGEGIDATVDVTVSFEPEALRSEIIDELSNVNFRT